MLQFLAKSDLLVDSIQDFRALAEVNSESPLFLLFKWNDTGGGYYWSSTYRSDAYAYGLQVSNASVVFALFRNYGHSVRLVMD